MKKWGVAERNAFEQEGMQFNCMSHASSLEQTTHNRFTQSFWLRASVEQTTQKILQLCSRNMFFFYALMFLYKTVVDLHNSLTNGFLKSILDYFIWASAIEDWSCSFFFTKWTVKIELLIC